MYSLTKQIVLRNRPHGWVTPEDFDIREHRLPELETGQVLIKVIYLSIDPYMRGRMDASKTYAKNFELNRPLEATAIGQIAQSRASKFKVDELVLAKVEWANFSVTESSKVSHLPKSIFPRTHYLGVLGMPGMTAWFGMRLADPKQGETVFVSAASGAVGQVVGQLAKIRGCRIVGSAGSEDKIRYLVRELGFDSAFNYKSAEPIANALKRAAPNGIDIYFDNVGGVILEAALDHANNFARFIQCGMISQYNLNKEETLGIRNLTHINRKRIRMEGFIVSDHLAQQAEFMTDMQKWLNTGRIVYRVDVTQGLENAIPAFISMLKGGNFGKKIVQIEKEP